MKLCVCECGEEIGQTLVGDRLHWTHGTYIGAQVNEPNVSVQGDAKLLQNSTPEPTEGES